MHETVTCPKCDRRLQLPAEFMGKEVQCPSCETLFIAGETKPRSYIPPPAGAISVEPTLPVPQPVDTHPDEEAPRTRRPRGLDVARPGAKKSRLMPLFIVLALAGCVFGAFLCCVIQQNRHHQGGFVDFLDNGPMPPRFGQEPPLVDVPDRVLTGVERQDHAKAFFLHFSAVMRNQNLADEAASFDALRVLETLDEHKLLREGWRGEQERFVQAVRQEVLQTSLYRGPQWWQEYEIKSVKQPDVRELIVVTRNLTRDNVNALRLRWWLTHRDGRWRIREVEFFDHGIRLSLLLAAAMRPADLGPGIAHNDLASVRNAANQVLVKDNFLEAERILGPLRPDNMPKACAATYHMLTASMRIRQHHPKRFEETLASCDAAQRCEPDLPGADFLRALAYNWLHRGELALKHAHLARDWIGDDPLNCYEIGLALHNLGRHAEAAPFYRKVLDEEPNNKDALLSLARCIGPGVKGDDIANRFLKMKRPQDHFGELAQDRWGMRDAATVLILAEAMRKVSPRHADAAYYLALAQAEQDRLAPALASLKAAIEFQDLDAQRNMYYTEFAKAIAFRNHALPVYNQLPDRLRSFRALGEALKNIGQTDELTQLMALHAKYHPKDPFLLVFQAEVLFRDEQYEQANAAFTKAFTAFKQLGEKDRDLAAEERFRFSFVQARYQTGDILGAYRDIDARAGTFQQLANLCWADKKADDLAKLAAVHAMNDPGDPGLARVRWRVSILNKRFDAAAKELTAALRQNVAPDQVRFLNEDFLFDMIDTGNTLEAYRHAPEPAESLETIATSLADGNRTKELEALLAEHRKLFPRDPVLLMFAGQQAAAKNDWVKAGQAYADGWKQLPEAKRPRWTHAYLFARFKQGQALNAYLESGKRAEHFRQLATMLLNEKQIDPFEQLLEGHRPQRTDDPEFAAYDARLKILRAKPADAAEILAASLKDLPPHQQRGITDRFQLDLAPFNVPVEIYRCIPDKRDVFAQMAWSYRQPERAKELELLVAEHAKHHPDDARLLVERAELHMLRNEFTQAEQQFALAKTKGQPTFDLARFGLIRARIKLGKAAETYQELGANPLAFQDVSNQCVTLKDAEQLQRVVAAHRKAFPALKSLAIWDVEVSWLKKDHEATIQAIQADRTGLLKNTTYRWKCESYLVRSLVRAKKSSEAVREAETISKRKGGPQVLLALALASTGDVPRVLAFLESKSQRYFIEDCYYDEDLGPLLRSDAFRGLHERFPPPPLQRKFANERFDD